MSVRQCFTLGSSLLSFGLAAKKIYLLMPTKQNQVKFSSWKDNLIVMPMTILITIPKMMSLALVSSYLKRWIFLLIGLYFLVMLTILFQWGYLKKEGPKNTIIGILTNIFTSCVVSNDHSKFFLRTSILSTFMHAISQVFLFCLVFGIKQLTTPPVTILHCSVEGSIKNVMRCNETCNVTFGNVSKCQSTLISVGGDYEDYKNLITCCPLFWWSPLAWACGVTIFLLSLSILGSWVLHKNLDKTLHLKFSRWKFESFWDDNNKIPKELTIAVKKFYSSRLPPYDPKSDQKDALHLIIQNNLYHFLKKYLETNQPEIDQETLQEALKEAQYIGDVKVIKLLKKHIENGNGA